MTTERPDAEHDAGPIQSSQAASQELASTVSRRPFHVRLRESRRISRQLDQAFGINRYPDVRELYAQSRLVEDPEFVHAVVAAWLEYRAARRRARDLNS